MSTKQRSLAVLIDGENTQQFQHIERVLAEAAKYGKVVIRRIYGNWQETPAWNKCFELHGVEPIQRPVYKDAQDAADIAMIMDAIDIFNSGKVGGFCLAASDGHFTGLAKRLREKNMFVAVMGSKQVMSDSLKNECDVFRYVEELAPSADPNSPSSCWKSKVKDAIHVSASDDEWVLLSVVVENVLEADSSFDPHDYCYTQSKALVESGQDEFETVDGKNIGKPPGYYVRLKPPGSITLDTV